MVATEVVHAYSTERVAELTGLSFRQLHYWDTIGVLVPSVSLARSSGTRRYYSWDDVRLAAILQAVAPGQQAYGRGLFATLARVRGLVAGAFRACPGADYFVVLDGQAVVACDVISDVVEASRLATVATVVTVDKIIPRWQSIPPG